MPTVLSPTVHAWVSEAREMQCEASLINTTKSYHLKTNLKTMAWPKKKKKNLIINQKSLAESSNIIILVW